MTAQEPIGNSHLNGEDTPYGKGTTSCNSSPLQALFNTALTGRSILLKLETTPTSKTARMYQTPPP